MNIPTGILRPEYTDRNVLAVKFTVDEMRKLSELVAAAANHRATDSDGQIIPVGLTLIRSFEGFNRYDAERKAGEYEFAGNPNPYKEVSSDGEPVGKLESMFPDAEVKDGVLYVACEPKARIEPMKVGFNLIGLDSRNSFLGSVCPAPGRDGVFMVDNNGETTIYRTGLHNATLTCLRRAFGWEIK